MNQWELEANTRNRRQAREKAGKTRVTKSRLDLVFHVIGWEGAASFLIQSQQSEVKQNFRHSN